MYSADKEKSENRYCLVPHYSFPSQLTDFAQKSSSIKLPPTVFSQKNSDDFTNLPQTTSKFWLLLEEIRPHQIIYLFTLLFLSFAVASRLMHTPSRFQSFFAENEFHILLTIVIIFLMVPAHTLLNDYVHRKKDLKVGRNIGVFSTWTAKEQHHQKKQNNTSRKENKEMFRVLLNAWIIHFLIVMILMAESLYLTLGAYMALLLTSLSYAILKHKNKVILMYICRMAAGFSTFLLFVSVFVPLNQFVFFLSFIVGLIDVATNIAGDIRDLIVDRKSAIKTLATETSEKTTLLIIFSLYAFSLMCLQIFISLPLVMILSFLFLLLGGLLLTIHIPRIWYHGVFHGIKIMFYLLIAVYLGVKSSQTAIAEIIMIIMIIVGWMCSWYAAYFLYVQAKMKNNFDLWNKKAGKKTKTITAVPQHIRNKKATI